MPRRTLTQAQVDKCNALTEAAMLGIVEYLRSTRGAAQFGASATVEMVRRSDSPDYVDVNSDGEAENYTITTQLEW